MSHRETIAAVLAAVQVRSATSFAWFGAVQGGHELDDETARQYLRYLLQNQLYAHFYCTGAPAPATSHRPWMPPGAAAQLVEALSEANTGAGALEPGWRVAGREDGRVVVERDGLKLWIDPHEAEGDDAEIRIRLPKELRRLNPGFYMALGDIGIDERAERLVRFYWHVTADAAPALVGELTGRLNAARLAFRLKVAGAPERYDRCDAGVLYVRHDDHEAARAHVAVAYERLRRRLLPATPALTKVLAPGLGVAEDPGDGQSFGMHRCGLLAEALAGAYESGGTAGLDHVEAVFEEAGIELDRPYLAAGSDDVYTLR